MVVDGWGCWGRISVSCSGGKVEGDEGGCSECGLVYLPEAQSWFVSYNIIVGCVFFFVFLPQ